MTQQACAQGPAAGLQYVLTGLGGQASVGCNWLEWTVLTGLGGQVSAAAQPWVCRNRLVSQLVSVFKCFSHFNKVPQNQGVVWKC